MTSGPCLCGEEHWLPIYGYARWEVSDRGRVRYETRIVPQYPNHAGYLRVKIDSKWKRVHLLVLHAFVGPRPSPRHHGAHGPGGQRNNCAWNLRWALPEENEADKKIAGTHRNGRRGPVTPARVVAQIVRAREGGASYISIARATGLHRHSVSRICRGLRRAS